MKTLLRFALLLGVPLASACHDDALLPPDPEAGTLFARYVAIGNSITAGFQSGGINDSTQREAYPLLLAQQMGLKIGETFTYPSLNPPGCPPPLANVFTQTPIATVPGGCALRSAEAPQFLNNVAVPGAGVIDVLDNLHDDSDANALTTILLGGLTQIEHARQTRPTFVTVWIGNNDVLGSILHPTNSGSLSLVTDSLVFAERYATMMDSLDTTWSIQGGVLIGVVQVGAIPYVSEGRAWEQFESTFDAQTSPLNALDVVNCLDNAMAGAVTMWNSVPFHYGATQLASANAKVDSVQQGTLDAAELQPAVIDCRNPPVAITGLELFELAAHVEAYNRAIEDDAAERDWVFLDPNPLLEQLRQDQTAVRPFPAFDPADPQHTTAPFGTALSLDGIHPSNSSHELIVEAIITAINAAYGTEIPGLP
jgi:hypothetical protein